jgi:hypothetical protein
MTFVAPLQLQGSSGGPKSLGGGDSFSSSSWFPLITAKTDKSLESIHSSSRSVGMKMGPTWHRFIGDLYLLVGHTETNSFYL